MQVLQRVSQHIQALTNERRRERGLSPLQRNFGLRELACQHSRDMISRSFFAHENPDGETPQDRAAQHHRQLVGQTGENIWSRTSGPPTPVTDAEALARKIVADWMGSSGHRKNILRDRFTHLGVCVVQEGNQFRATQTFADARAFFDDPLPKQMAPSSQRTVSVTPVPPSGPTPVRYEFWSPAGEQRVAGPYPFEGRIRAPKTEGRVQLRLHVPASEGFVLASGPILQVSGEAGAVAANEQPDRSEPSLAPAEKPSDSLMSQPEVAETRGGPDAALDFQADVIEASRDTPVLVDFWAPWCGPCQELNPRLESLAKQQDGWSLAKVNVDAHRRIAQRYDVRRVPTVTLFVDGTADASFTGAKSESEVQEWLDENVSSLSAADSSSPDSTSGRRAGW